MEELIAKIALGLVTTAIIALIKMYGDLRQVNTQHKNLQLEVNEHKRNTKEDFRHISSEHKNDFDHFKAEVSGRFDKIEKLIQKLYRYEVNKKRDD
jgi:hypothetical protein